MSEPIIDTLPVEQTEEKPKPKKMTMEELYAQASKDEQLKVVDLPWDTDPSLAKAMMVERYELLENISFESKARATVIAKKLRELEASSGKNRWDKGRGKENPLNSSDPATNKYVKSAKDKHKIELTKVEKQVSAMLQMGDEENDIINMLTKTGKFKGIEVREAIEKMKKGS